MKKILSLSLIRSVAIIFVLAGAAGSIGLVLYNGRHNQSILLIALFVAWVVSPLFAFLVADRVSKNWLDNSRKSLYITALVLTIISLLSYIGIFSPAGTKTAFVFLVVPLISLVILAVLTSCLHVLSHAKSSF